ncbi:MAG TPA: HAMP domain-containing sensor histidine kinase [Clostridia bacterium]|nr:HAMP domain-containing sensor histidine kinase [Clostridia bacterium]
MSAFWSFSSAADALQRSYGRLQDEVARLRLQLEKTTKELEREKRNSARSRALAEVSAMLAHEIRNLLASMELFTGLLERSQSLAGEDRRWVSQMSCGVRSLAATVNNVLTFHADAPVQTVPVDLVEVVERAVEFLKPLAEHSAISLRITNSAAKCVVPADATAIQQVLMNLVMNALRHTEPAGKITVAIGEAGPWVELCVCDTGRGIATEDLERIFDAGATTTSMSAGLGLAVCRKIVEQHGGTITAENTAAGACFRVRLRKYEGHGA